MQCVGWFVQDPRNQGLCFKAVISILDCIVFPAVSLCCCIRYLQQECHCGPGLLGFRYKCRRWAGTQNNSGYAIVRLYESINQANGMFSSLCNIRLVQAPFPNRTLESHKCIELPAAVLWANLCNVWFPNPSHATFTGRSRNYLSWWGPRIDN